jgi:hypothetical protein
LESCPKDNIIERIRDIVAEIDKVSKTARKHNKSLSGDNFYGNKFDGLRADLIQARKELEPVVERVGNADLKESMESLAPHFDTLANPDTSQSARSFAKKQLLFLVDSEVEPFIGSSGIGRGSITEEVIPMDVVRGTRGYIEKVALQANGCYESGWFDACAVMIRRLIETLIVECFEHYHKEAKIKDSDGNYFPLKLLIAICLKEDAWTLSRNARDHLPKLKNIGDLSAHNRRFLATKSDIDRIHDGVRLAVEELIHLSRLKD